MSEQFESVDSVSDQLKRQILDARQRAAEGRMRNMRGMMDGVTPQKRLLGYRELIEEYIIELEPLWYKTRILDKFWTDEGEPLGHVFAQPPNPEDLIENTSDHYRNGHPPVRDSNLSDPKHVATIQSIRHLLDAPDKWTAEWWVESKPRHGPVIRSETTAVTVVGSDTLDSCLRAANHFASRAGIGIDPEVEPHRSADPGL